MRQSTCLALSLAALLTLAGSLLADDMNASAADSMAKKPAAPASDDQARLEILHSEAHALDVSRLSEPMRLMTPFIGNWEINAKWADGSALWARNEYRVGLGGNFVDARTYAKDGDGGVYERYKTFFSRQDGEWSSYGFTNDGTVTVIESLTVEDVDGHSAIETSWKAPSGQTFKQRVQMTSDDAYRWQVWVAQGDDWMQMMDDTWHRVD